MNFIRETCILDVGLMETLFFLWWV